MMGKENIKNESEDAEPLARACFSTSHQSPIGSRCFVTPSGSLLRLIDQRRGPVPELQPQFLRRIRRDDRGNMLLSDRQRDLRQQPAEFDRHHASDQLVAPADLPPISPPRLDVPPLQLLRNRRSISLSGTRWCPPGVSRLDLSVVDPLLQGGIADAQNIRRFPWREQLLHDKPPENVSLSYIESLYQYVFIRLGRKARWRFS